jgi:hypothetical protein
MPHCTRCLYAPPSACKRTHLAHHHPPESVNVRFCLSSRCRHRSKDRSAWIALVAAQSKRPGACVRDCDCVRVRIMIGCARAQPTQTDTHTRANMNNNTSSSLPSSPTTTPHGALGSLAQSVYERMCALFTTKRHSASKGRVGHIWSCSVSHMLMDIRLNSNRSEDSSFRSTSAGILTHADTVTKRALASSTTPTKRNWHPAVR